MIDARRQGSRRSHRGEVGPAQVRHEARRAAQPPPVQGHRRRHRAGRRRRGRHARRARLRRPGLHVPRLAPAGALDRRAGRHQRRQELQGRRRLDLPPLLRHGEGRRLPRPRGERVPARAGVGRHHRPVRRAGRAVRPRVRRPARQPLLRRRAGVAHVLRPRPDRPAAAARRVPGAGAPGRARHRHDLPALRDARPRREGRRGLRHRRPRPRTPARSRSHSAHAVVLATGGYGNVFFLSTNAKASNATAIWRAHRQGRAVRQPVLHADPPDVHPGERRLPVEAHADVRVAAQRRPHLGARRRSTTRARPTRSPRTSATTSSSAATPRFGNLVPRDVASRAIKTEVDEGRGVGPLKNGVYLDFADAIDRLGRDVDRGALREPLRDVRAHHRRGPVRRCRCASTPRSTTRWAGSGSTTTCSRPSPAASSPARPTSPTTAPTGSARRR